MQTRGYCSGSAEHLTLRSVLFFCLKNVKKFYFALSGKQVGSSFNYFILRFQCDRIAGRRGLQLLLTVVTADSRQRALALVHLSHIREDEEE